MKLIENLYQYRELLKSNIKKEIRGKYKGSVLGVLWSFLNPLLMVMVYFLVFPFLFRNTVDNYLIYLVIGVIPWNFFTTTMNQGIMTIRVNEGIIKKVYFPREILLFLLQQVGLLTFHIVNNNVIIFVYLVG